VYIHIVYTVTAFWRNNNKSIRIQLFTAHCRPTLSL